MTFHQSAGFVNNRLRQGLVARRSETLATIAVGGLFGNPAEQYHRKVGYR